MSILLQSPLTVASAASLGKVIELSWVPLPAPVGPGSVLVLAMEDGSLAFVDAVQTVEQPSQRQRLATFRGLLAGALPGQAQATSAFVGTTIMKDAPLPLLGVGDCSLRPPNAIYT